MTALQSLPGAALGRIHLANDEETLLPQFGSIIPAGFAGDYCSEPPPVGTNKNNTVRKPNHPHKNGQIWRENHRWMIMMDVTQL